VEGGDRNRSRPRCGIYSLVEAKTRGLIFHNWLLLPPRSYLAGIVSLLALVVGTWQLARRGA